MGVRSKEPLHHPLPWGPPLPAAVHSRLSPPQQAQPRQDGEVTPTLDMALFDWTDYEDLKPEVWPSAEKKGTPPPVPGVPSQPLSPPAGAESGPVSPV